MPDESSTQSYATSFVIFEMMLRSWTFKNMPRRMFSRFSCLTLYSVYLLVTLSLVAVVLADQGCALSDIVMDE